MCVCLRIVVCPTQTVLCFCFVCLRPVSHVSHAADVSGLYMFDCSLVLSNVVLHCNRHTLGR